jgi:hypothetical protein
MHHVPVDAQGGSACDLSPNRLLAAPRLAGIAAAEDVLTGAVPVVLSLNLHGMGGGPLIQVAAHGDLVAVDVLPGSGQDQVLSEYILLPTAKLVAPRSVRAGDSFVRVSA